MSDPASPYNTWEHPDGARRPTIVDVGGAELEDEEGEEPENDGTEPYAAMLNQGQYQAFAQGRTASPVKITIDFAGDPFVDKLQCTDSRRVTTDFAVSRPGGAAVGRIFVDVDDASIPPFVCDPIGGCNDPTQTKPSVVCVVETVGVPVGKRRIQVYLRQDGVLTDFRATIHYS